MAPPQPTRRVQTGLFQGYLIAAMVVAPVAGSDQARGLDAAPHAARRRTRDHHAAIRILRRAHSALTAPPQLEPSQGLADEVQFGENISQFALLGTALKSLERIAGVSFLSR